MFLAGPVGLLPSCLLTRRPLLMCRIFFVGRYINVCALSPGDVIILPCSSFMLRILLSARICCIRRMLSTVGSPSSLPASSSMRTVFSLSLWSINFCFYTD